MIFCFLTGFIIFALALVLVWLIGFGLLEVLKERYPTIQQDTNIAIEFLTGFTSCLAIYLFIFFSWGFLVFCTDIGCTILGRK